MKYLFLIFISISIIAQEDILMKREFNKNSDYYSLLNLTKLEKKHLYESILELKNNREWINNIDKVDQEYQFYNFAVINFKEKEPNFIDTNLFLIMAGSAIVLGATAAYFKLESDSIYEEYLETNKKSLLRKTDRYDLYSGIAFGVLQINFGFMIYKFLTD